LTIVADRETIVGVLCAEWISDTEYQLWPPRICRSRATNRSPRSVFPIFAILPSAASLRRWAWPYSRRLASPVPRGSA